MVTRSEWIKGGDLDAARPLGRFQLDARYVAAATAAGAPLPGPNDIVTHLRWCSTCAGCKSVAERVAFFDRVLPRLTYDTLWVVMPLSCEDSELYQTLRVMRHGVSCYVSWCIMRTVRCTGRCTA